MTHSLLTRRFLPALLCPVVALGFAGLSGCSKSEPEQRAKTAEQQVQELYPKLMALEAREAEARARDWGKEVEAQRFGAVLDQLWDSLNQSENKLKVLSVFDVDKVVLPRFGSAKNLGNQMEVFSPEESHSLGGSEWRDFLAKRGAEAWQLEQMEIRHIQFSPATNGSGAISKVYLFGGLTNSSTSSAAALEGDILVMWENAPNSSDDVPRVKSIDASRVQLQMRKGRAPFQLIADQTFFPLPKTPFIDPLMVYDLDMNGELEIILAALNQKFHLRDGVLHSAGNLCAVPPGIITAALIADFTGDGLPDFLCARRSGLAVYRGTSDGAFPGEPEIAWTADPGLKYALVMTCGDVDGDGDLDVWLTQYRVPYLQGAMPEPYYDANNGYPSYLLQNDGSGKFRDVTVGSGLEQKRFRFTYSTSFIDFDGDQVLDLLVVSDFAGIDIYKGEGKGKFQDVTKQWIDAPYAAGMAHSIADFNRDLKPDFLAIGMHSPTVDRLEHAQLTRTDTSIDQNKRKALMEGNRLYLKSDDGFQETRLSESIRRAGWAWGSAAFDWDNDGWLDVAIANGHETKQSVQDYDPEFWLHDIYVGTGKEAPLNLLYFSAKHTRTRGRGWSYGGWDRNRLFWNREGMEFLDGSYLSGTSLAQDSRNVVAADLNNDGKLDLLVTTFEAWPQMKQTLKVFLNQTEESGNWVAVKLHEDGPGFSPIGAEVKIRAGGFATSRTIVAGDSFRSQHPPIVHFGLGSVTNISEISVRWLNGKSKNLANPKINQVHLIKGN